MANAIPAYFSRRTKTFIKVANGTVVVTPMNGSDDYWITAPGHRRQRVDAHELPYVVRQLVNLCGGAQKHENATDIVANLLEAEDDAEAFIQREIDKRVQHIKSLEIIGRRWHRRGPGGVYCRAYIYINDKLVHVTPQQYGYGSQYLHLAVNWLRRNGYLEGLLDERELRDKLGIDLRYHAVDVVNT